MGKKIILVSGFKESGKDTFSSILKNELFSLGVNSSIKHLAMHLKSTCSDVFDLPIKYMLEQEFKEVFFEEPITLNREHLVKIFKSFNENGDEFIEKHIGVKFKNAREIMQYIGTEVLRDLSSEIHCEVLDSKLNSDEVVLVSDNRFTNEIEYFSRYETLNLFVKRDSKTPERSESLHQSEKEMFEVMNMVRNIDNNLGLSELRVKAEQIAREFVKQISK